MISFTLHSGLMISEARHSYVTSHFWKSATCALSPSLLQGTCAGRCPTEKERVQSVKRPDIIGCHPSPNPFPPSPKLGLIANLGGASTPRLERPELHIAQLAQDNKQALQIGQSGQTGFKQSASCLNPRCFTQKLLPTQNTRFFQGSVGKTWFSMVKTSFLVEGRHYSRG